MKDPGVLKRRMERLLSYVPDVREWSLMLMGFVPIAAKSPFNAESVGTSITIDWTLSSVWNVDIVRPLHSGMI